LFQNLSRLSKWPLITTLIDRDIRYFELYKQKNIIGSDIALPERSINIVISLNTEFSNKLKV